MRFELSYKQGETHSRFFDATRSIGASGRDILGRGTTIELCLKAV